MIRDIYKRVLVLGRGMVGQAFERQGFTAWGRGAIDFPYPDDGSTPSLYDLARMLLNYDIIVNAIGKADTRWCESNYSRAMWSNADVPAMLARVCRDMNKLLIHVSTGCVYPSGCVFHHEGDRYQLTNSYLLSKMCGEMAIRTLGDHAVILRPRLIFSDSPSKFNLLNKLTQFDKFTIEPETITSTSSIVDIVEHIAHQDDLDQFRGNTYNVGCASPISPYAIAEILEIKKGPLGIYCPDRQSDDYVATQTLMDLDASAELVDLRDTVQELKRCWKACDLGSKSTATTFVTAMCSKAEWPKWPTSLSDGKHDIFQHKAGHCDNREAFREIVEKVDEYTNSHVA